MDAAIAARAARLAPVVPTAARGQGGGARHAGDARVRWVPARGDAGRADTVLRVAVPPPVEGPRRVAPSPPVDEGEVVPRPRRVVQAAALARGLGAAQARPGAAPAPAGGPVVEETTLPQVEGVRTEPTLEPVPLVAARRRRAARAAAPQGKVAVVVATVVGAPRVTGPLGRGARRAALLGVAGGAGAATAAVEEGDVVAKRRRPARAASRVAEAAARLQAGVGHAPRVEAIAAVRVGHDAPKVKAARLAVAPPSAVLRPVVHGGAAKKGGPVVGARTTAPLVGPRRPLASGRVVRLGPAHLRLTPVRVVPKFLGMAAFPVGRDWVPPP